MTDGKRKIPVIVTGDCTVSACSVCDIDNIIGSPADECDIQYSDPAVEYSYGYDFVTAICARSIHAYYIGVDRFYERDGSYGKEYALYELGVYLGGGLEIFGLLYRHLCELARVTGCERIVLRGATGELHRLLTADGFVERDGMLIGRVEGAVLPYRDRLVIPTDKDALTHGELFFLREQGFVLDGERCRFDMDGRYIEIDRSRGTCQFSDGFSVIGGELSLGSARALCIIDVCVQLMKIRVSEDIQIHLTASVGEGCPDISFGQTAIFLPEVRLTLKEVGALRARLRTEGKYERYGVYYFKYDYEVGGTHIAVAFAKI